MSFKRRNHNARPKSPHLEELEPRILYSADLAPQAEVVEVRVETEASATTSDIQPCSNSDAEDKESVASEADILYLDESDEVIANIVQYSTSESRNELIFVDANLTELGNQLTQSNSEPLSNIVQIDPERDAWTQILDTLSQYENLDAIHFISHGSEEGFALGDQWITPDNLADFEDEFRVMQLSLSETADLHFYGCDIAANSSGQSMIATIADWTGADVAASTDLTGHSSLGGDWQLEYQVGEIEDENQLSASSVEWLGLLSPPTDIANGIAINTNGGDDVFLETKDAITSNLTQLTVEASFAIDTPNVIDNNLVSYLKGFNHNELYLTVQASGKINFAVDSIGTGEFISSGTYAQLLDGEQHHVAVSWDNSNGAVVLYIDGAFAESTTGYKTGATVNSDGTLVLGQDQDIFSTKDPDQAFKGTYYDTRIWNTVRSTGEIGDNYQHSFDSGNIPVGLIANWQMKEVTGSNTIVDLVNPGVADLEVKHVSDAAFTAGTITDALSIDENSANSTHIGFVIPTDPDPGATPSYTFTLTDDAGGRFAIDLNSGEITVANGSLLDYETNSSHNITIEVTDGDTNTFSKAITIQVNDINEASVANAGGPYTVGKGGSLTLNGLGSSDPDSDTLSYAWDIDNNGSYGDVTGATPTLTWTDLQSYGIGSDGTYNIGLRVDDGNGETDTHSTTITVAEYAPSGLSSGISLNTDGGNDAYLIADDGSTLLGGLTAFTLETSFSLEDHNNEPSLISYYVGGDEIRLRFDTTDHLRLKINSINVTTSSTYSELLDGNRHHVAVSWDNTNGDVMFYIDGKFVEHITGLQSGHTIAAGGELAFGNEQDGLDTGYSTGQTLHGTLHDVRIWNIVRSADEIALNYQQKLDLTPVEAAAIGLAANWQMEGFNGSNQVIDIVSANNLSIAHATGSGFATSTPTTGLQINENAANGTSVGYVQPHDSDIFNDIVTDGLFLEHNMGGAFEQVAVGNFIGDWEVIDETSVIYNDEATYGSTPLGGRPIELGMSDGPSTIEQDLNTVSGRQYQVIFSMSGDWVGGDATKNLRVHTGAIDTDFSMDEPNNWSTSNRVWDTRSVTFTATGATTTLAFESLVTNIPQYNVLISDVRVVELSDAVSKILADDASLSYDAGTGKFYKTVTTVSSWAGANSTAQSTALNGIQGNLVSIGSQYENSLVQSMAIAAGGDIWLGATDQTTEGEFYWQSSTGDGDLFWTGGNAGSALAYENWTPGSPRAPGTGEDYVVMENTDGSWHDFGEGMFRRYIIEWDANEVLSSYTYSLTDDAGGRFAFDANTGQITVADSSLIDFETANSHNITVQVVDAMGSSYSEVLSVAVNNIGGDAQWTVPIAQNTNEDSPLVFSTGNGNAISVTSGNPDHPIFVSTISVTQGTLTLASTTGLSFLSGSSNGDATISVSGIESDINNALEGLSYLPNSDYSGADTLTVTTGSSGLTEASLYARYEFLDASLNDESGNGNDAVKVGGPIINLDTDRGDTLYFDGDDELVITNGTLGLSDEITIAAWVNLDAAQGDNIVLSLGDQMYIELDNNSSGWGVGAYAFGAGTYTVGGGEIDVAGDGWHHVAATFSNATDEFKVYIDGVLERDFGPGVAAVPNWASYASQDIVIGNLSGSQPGSVPMVGSLDDVRIYNAALSETEIAAMMGDQGYDQKTVALTVNTVNDAPTFSNLDGNPNFTEDGSAVLLDTNVTVSDPELSGAEHFSSATLTLSRNGGASSDDTFNATGNLSALSQGGNLQLSGVTIGTVTTNSAGTLLLTFNSNATQIRVDEALQSIAYSNSSDAPPTTVQIDWRFDDGNSGSQGSGGPLTATGSTTINITPENDAPIFGGSNALTNIAEDDVTNSGTEISTLIAAHITDADGPATGIAIIDTDTSNGSWEYTLNNGGTWVAMGSVSDSNARLLADDANTRIRFIPNANYNGTINNAIRFHAWDQTTGRNGGLANVSGIETVADNFSTESYANNDGTTSWAGSWIESDSKGGGASDGEIEIDHEDFDLDINADSTGDHLYREVDLSGATSANLSFDFDNRLEDADEIRVQISDDGGASYSTVLTFTSALNTGAGSANVDISAYIAADTRVRFYVFNSDKGEDLRVDNLSISFNAGTPPGGSTAFSATAQDSTITVDPVNDEQNITTNTGATVFKGSGGNTITNTMLETTDIDNTTAELVYRVDAIPTNGTLYNNGVALANTDTFTQADINAGLITYDHDNSATVSDSMIFTVDDGVGMSMAQFFNWTISSTNVSPVITSDGGGAIANISVDENQTAVTTVTSFDVDGGAPSYSISGGADQALFNINSSTGVLAFDASKDFESPSDNNTDGIYEVEVTVADGNGGTDLQTINVTISNVDEAPSLGGITGVTISEGGTASGNITATDPDGLTDGSYYTMSTPASNGAASINPASGLWSYTPSDPNWFGTDSFVVTITDDLGGTATIGVTVTVNNIDDLPSITGDIAGSGNKNTEITGDLNATDLDGLTDGSYFSVTTPATQGIAAIDATTGNWSFTPTDSNWSGSDNFTVTITDDQGGTQTLVIAITVIDATGSAPSITNQTINLAENAVNGAILYDVNDSNTGNDLDLDGEALSYSLIAGNDNGLFAINAATGVVTLVNASGLDYESTSTYVLQIQASDGSLNASAQLTIQLDNVNEAPVISAPGSLTVDEDNALSIGTVSVADQDAGTNPIQVTITATHGVMQLGDQSNLNSVPVSDALNQFTITGSVTAINKALAGLSFIPDENYNGAASITVLADDLGNSGSGSPLSDSHVISITILPINDEPALDVPEQLEIQPGEAIEFSTALNNLAPLQDLDSQTTQHHLSLNIENASLSLADDSLMPHVEVTETGDAIKASGDMATMNAILNALIITPDEHFYGELTLDLYLEDEGSVDVGSTRSLSTQIHLLVPSPPLPIDSSEQVSDKTEQEQSDSEQLILIEFEDNLTRIRTENDHESDDDLIIPPLAFHTQLNGSDGLQEYESSALHLRDTPSTELQTSNELRVSPKFDLLKSVLLTVDTDPFQNNIFSPSLHSLANGLESPEALSETAITVRIAEITGAGLVVGSVVWLLKSSSLLSSLLVSYPAWRGMDPLPVLLPKDNENTLEDELPKEKPKNPRFELSETTPTR